MTDFNLLLFTLQQSLWTLTTLKLVSLMKITAWLSGNYLQSLFAHNNHFLTATNSITSVNTQTSNIVVKQADIPIQIQISLLPTVSTNTKTLTIHQPFVSQNNSSSHTAIAVATSNSTKTPTRTLCGRSAFLTVDVEGVTQV
ncbi:hypothetical protein BY996DRAFT_7173778 [Phakopsora pachyrhizi]|nr:hypothetical protein BY996DRAFT_7173778 [Phakopsora pachyrhizi]